MKIKLLKNPKSSEFMDAINIYVETFPHDWDYIPVIRRLIKNKINKNRKLYLLGAIENGRVLGASLYSYWKDKKTGVLEYLFVKKSLRSKGVGSKLYLATVKELKKKKSKHFVFNVASDENFKKPITPEEIIIRKRRLTFYEKLGARPIDNLSYENPLHLSQLQEDYHPSYLALDEHFSNKIDGKELYQMIKRFYRRFYYGANEKNSKTAERVLKSINKNTDYLLRNHKYTKND